MTKMIRLFIVLSFLLCAAIPVAMAHDAAISSMAAITMHLNHYPSDNEKTALAAIAHDEHASSGVRTLAGALMRMQHSIGGNDAKALHTLAADEKASQGERELAEILLGIQHHPSASDQQRLKKLTN